MLHQYGWNLAWRSRFVNSSTLDFTKSMQSLCTVLGLQNWKFYAVKQYRRTMRILPQDYWVTNIYITIQRLWLMMGLQRPSWAKKLDVWAFSGENIQDLGSGWSVYMASAKRLPIMGSGTEPLSESRGTGSGAKPHHKGDSLVYSSSTTNKGRPQICILQVFWTFLLIFDRWSSTKRYHGHLLSLNDIKCVTGCPFSAAPWAVVFERLSICAQ